MEHRLPAPPARMAINDDRMMCYAVLGESIQCRTSHGLLFVDGKEVGNVPRRAICQDRESKLFTLYLCDEDWGISAAAAEYATVDAAKRKAARIYPGCTALWVDCAQGK